MANICKIIALTEELVVCAHRCLKISEHRTIRGGYLAVINHKRGQEEILAKVGQVNSKESLKLRQLACEQAWRLYHTGEVTSFASRDPGAMITVYDQRQKMTGIHFMGWGKWGGAVRGDRYIFSFSGFNESLDEAMMFALAVKMEQIKKDFVLKCLEERDKVRKDFLDICHIHQ